MTNGPLGLNLSTPNEWEEIPTEAGSEPEPVRLNGGGKLAAKDLAPNSPQAVKGRSRAALEEHHAPTGPGTGPGPVRASGGQPPAVGGFAAASLDIVKRRPHAATRRFRHDGTLASAGQAVRWLESNGHKAAVRLCAQPEGGVGQHGKDWAVTLEGPGIAGGSRLDPGASLLLHFSADDGWKPEICSNGDFAANYSVALAETGMSKRQREIAGDLLGKRGIDPQGPLDAAALRRLADAGVRGLPRLNGHSVAEWLDSLTYGDAYAMIGRLRESAGEPAAAGAQ